MYLINHYDQIVQVTDYLGDALGAIAQPGEDREWTFSEADTLPMQYIVFLHHYASGSGHINSEKFEAGECDQLFSASDWRNNAGLDDPDGCWTDVEVRFYLAGSDTEIAVSKSGDTICGKY